MITQCFKMYFNKHHKNMGIPLLKDDHEPKPNATNSNNVELANYQHGFDKFDESPLHSRHSMLKVILLIDHNVYILKFI